MDQAGRKHIVEISIDQLQANPLQPRGVITPESVTELMESIKEHGILEPLVVAHTPAGYQIIVGERRWRAAKIAGKTTVPCIVKETSPRGMLEMAIVENVQREELNPIDRAKAFETLVNEFSLGKAQIAKRISKSPSYISNTLKLLELPDALKDGLLSGLISEGHARALQGIHDLRLMIEAYKIVLKESASVRRAEEIARRMRVAAGQPLRSMKETAESEQIRYILSERVDKMEDEIKSTLGEKTTVKLRRSKRQTKLTIVLSGTPKETDEMLRRLHKAIAGMNPNLEGGQ